MKTNKYSRMAGALRIAPAFLILMFAVTFLAHHLAGRPVGDRNAGSSASAHPSEPWAEAQTVQPAELVKEMADAKGANTPVVVCSGFRVLCEGAHIRGAVYDGPASKPEGLDDLKKWAQGIPRSSNLVVYFRKMSEHSSRLRRASLHGFSALACSCAPQ